MIEGERYSPNYTPTLAAVRIQGQSTKTMVWFFTEVMGHKDPIRGLFASQKRLYEHYRVQEQLDLVTSLNKAFPFRLYESVEPEEDA